MGKAKIAVVIGSLRKGSFNRQLAGAVEKLAADRFEFAETGIGEIPLYNQDHDADFPAAGLRFKQQIEAADALLIVTPEYNRSIPGVLKNAIDTGSRPPSRNSFQGKPAAVIGTSPGARGSMLAQQHLRNVLVGVGVLAMPQPEVAVQFKEGLIDAEGNITDERTRNYLQGFAERFDAWLRKPI